MAVEPPTQEDGDDITQIESHGSEREDGTGGDGTSKVEQSGEDADYGGEPDSAERGVSFLRVFSEVASIGKAYTRRVSRRIPKGLSHAYRDHD